MMPGRAVVGNVINAGVVIVTLVHHTTLLLIIFLQQRDNWCWVLLHLAENYLITCNGHNGG